jgi:glycosyltransferase involved in cell wall biosynthesis
VTPTLSVVIPFYNEPQWIEPVVDDLVCALSRAPFACPELIIVDDGSDEAGQVVLDSLRPSISLRVLRQENQGRFAARRRGVEAAQGDLVLLLDARVSLAADALLFVACEMKRTGPRPIWNGHVDVDFAGNPYGRFWRVLESLAFRAYLDDPRTTSFGLEDFDRYPKGTTCFLAPRDELLRAMSQFRSYYDDARNANDDTPVIRDLAARQPINISPGFACLYRSRDAPGPFIRHAFHRGGVFVDGYGRPGTRYFGVIAAFYPASLIAVGLAVRRPRLGIAGAAGLPAVGAAAGVALRRTRPDTVALAAVGPLWLGAFAAGMWRGLGLAVRARIRRLREAAPHRRAVVG